MQLTIRSHRSRDFAQIGHGPANGLQAWRFCSKREAIMHGLYQADIVLAIANHQGMAERLSREIFQMTEDISLANRMLLAATGMLEQLIHA